MRGPKSQQPAAPRRAKGARSRKGRARSAKSTRTRVPGGKVRARFALFLQQRADQMGRTAVEEAQNATKAAPRRPARGRMAKLKGRSPLLAAYEQPRALAAAAMPVQQAWRPMGPFCVPHGQTYGKGARSRPSVSGRISAIAVDPGNPLHLLIGAAGGGVWESSDDGLTWHPRTDDQPSLAIGAVAFDPTNTAIVYAGTGEGNSTFEGSPNLLGVGLLRSTDGGTTWAVHAQAPFERVGFFHIAIDPANGNHLLAATTEGLFASTDGGATWTSRRSHRTWEVSFRPIGPGATGSTEAFAACDDGLFRSTNGGTSWSAVTLPGAAGTIERMAVCHAPSDGNVVYVFAVTGGTGRIWRRAATNTPFTAVPIPGDLDVGQAWYDWFAGVAPNNPDVVYIGAINAHKGMRSATGVWSWSNVSGRPSAFGDSIHPDQHAIAFSPLDPNVIYVANDGGLYRSPDGGTTWKSLNDGLNITEIEFIAQHPQFEAWLLTGTQDNGTLRYQGDTVWHHVGDGDGGDCGVDASAPYTCFHTYYGMGIARSTKGGNWSSWTGAPDWVVGPPVGSNDDYPNGSLFYPPVEVNGGVLVQAGRKIFISSDSGTSWGSVSLPGLLNREMSSALAAPSTTRIYAGTNAGKLFRTDFVQGAWKPAVALTTPVRGFMSDLLVDPTNGNRLYATYSSSQTGGRVFRSDDAGASWNQVDAGLPAALPVNAIEIDPANTDTLFVAADVGVYVTRTAGATWTPFNNGLPNCLVKDLQLHPEARLLRAGTQARGVWEIAVDAATMPDVDVYLRDSAVDTGRLSPSPSGVDDPFQFGAQTFWWQCKDIKIDAPSFLRPALTDVNFVVFGDDQSLSEAGIEFAAGLINENPQRNRTVRVYVQVHNGGVNPANKVAVKVFYSAGSLTFADLPANFWANFPSNVIAPASAWQPIGAHKELATVRPGRSELVGFEWLVPTTAPSQLALLAITSADNDTLSTTELNVATLVRSQKKCGLRNVMVVNPPPNAGSPVMAVPLRLTQAGAAATTSLHADRGAASLLRAIVLGKRLAKLAKQAKWKQVKLTAEDKLELARIVANDPALGKELQTTVGHAPKKGALLEDISLGSNGDPIVLLVKPDPRTGYGSLLQVDPQGTVLGGITLQAR